MEGNKMRIKNLFPLLAMFTITFGVFGQSYIPEDDIYYQPNDKNPVVEQKKKEKLTEQKLQQELVATANQNRIRERNVDVDEYNRRTDSDNYSTEEVQSDSKDSRSVKNARNVRDEDEGYYQNGFKGSDNDFEYSERIRRFQDPRFTILISDPGYNDIYMLNSSDWNVYIDNSAAWVTPTWTNSNYWNYTWTPYNYNSFSWRWNFGMGNFGMSWGSPYYGSYWNRPWGYDPYYSWGGGGHHHHGPHYGWGGYPNYGHHYPSWNNKPQPRPSRWGNSTGNNRNDNNGRYPVRNGTINTSNGNSRFPTTTVNKNPITNESRPNVNQTGRRTRITTQPTGTTSKRPTSVNTESSVNNRTTYTRGSSDSYRNSVGNSSTPSRSTNSSTSKSYESTTRSTSTPSYNSGSSSGSSTRSSGSMSSGSSSSSSSSGGGRRSR